MKLVRAKQRMATRAKRFFAGLERQQEEHIPPIKNRDSVRMRSHMLGRGIGIFGVMAITIVWRLFA